MKTTSTTLIVEILGVIILTIFATKMVPVLASAYSSAGLENVSFDGGVTTEDYSWTAGLGFLIFAIVIALLPLGLIGLVIYQLTGK